MRYDWTPPTPRSRPRRRAHVHRAKSEGFAVLAACAGAAAVAAGGVRHLLPRSEGFAGTVPKRRVPLPTQDAIDVSKRQRGSGSSDLGVVCGPRGVAVLAEGFAIAGPKCQGSAAVVSQPSARPPASQLGSDLLGVRRKGAAATLAYTRGDVAEATRALATQRAARQPSWTSSAACGHNLVQRGCIPPPDSGRTRRRSGPGRPECNASASAGGFCRTQGGRL